MAKRRERRGGGPGPETWRGPWLVHFFQRHPDDDPGEAVPVLALLDEHPAIRAKVMSVVKAVAETPPPAFAGGGKWEAMHGEMAGFYEVRVDGPGRRHYRVFCVLERDGAALGLGGPSIVLITGMAKEFRTTFTARDYEKVRQLGAEYRSRKPRSVMR
jgi:Txe/YoeB family toxin of Txe-Axe toxin-antitoxin module